MTTECNVSPSRSDEKSINNSIELEPSEQIDLIKTTTNGDSDLKKEVIKDDEEMPMDAEDDEKTSAIKQEVKEEKIDDGSRIPNGIDHTVSNGSNGHSHHSEDDEVEDHIAPLKMKRVNGDATNEIDLSKMVINDEERLKRKDQLREEKCARLKKLQFELRNEETKLILLKRLYYSQKIVPSAASIAARAQLNQQQLKGNQLNKNPAQMNKPGIPVNNQVPVNPQQRSLLNNKKPNQPLNLPNNAAGINRGLNNSTPSANQQGVRPGQGSQQLPSKQQLPIPNQRPNQQQNTNRPLQNPQQTQQAPFQKQLNSGVINSSAVSPHHRLANNNSPINNLPNKMYPGSPATSGPSGLNSPSVSNMQPPSALSPSSAFSPSLGSSTVPSSNSIDPKKTAASQVVVSQLVRKELEKSLAQIEFPKPPPNDMYFLPNTNSSEFLMCLGLEEVVKCVQEHLTSKQQKQENKQATELIKQENDSTAVQPTPPTKTIIEIKYDYPKCCAQCNTDFTPVWRTDKNGVVLCEKCLKTLEKKQIKTEHNARLKQAFLKAVKDKEVFEKQLLAEQQQQQLLLQQQRQQQQQQQRSNVAAPIPNNHYVPPQQQSRNSSPSVQQKFPNNNSHSQFSSPSSSNIPHVSSRESFSSPSPSPSANHHNSRHQPSPLTNSQQQRRPGAANSTPQSQQIKQPTPKSSPAVPNNHSNNNHQNVNRSNLNNSNHHQNHSPLNQQVKKPSSNDLASSSNRHRQSTGNSSNNLNNSHHHASSPSLGGYPGSPSATSLQSHLKQSASSANLNNQSSNLNAAAAAAAAQFHTSALAALAQQQQQQQFIQRLMTQPQPNFNQLLGSLQQPNIAALANYLSMLPGPNQRKNP